MKDFEPIYKQVGWKEVEVAVKCPWCGSIDMTREDEEDVVCLTCGHKTDYYGAMKCAKGGEKGLNA